MNWKRLSMLVSLLEVGKIALGFARSKKLKACHELAYVIEAKERLEKP
jgi:hypothetical protein